MKQVRIEDGYFGDGRRLEYQENELRNAPIVPNPVEYEDIDKAVFDFFDSNVDITTDDGERVPTFRLFSNQRFTEYSQTWRHTDKDGNLLMNFKTVTRDTNPQFGQMQGGHWNIPGRNRFTVCMREIVDDTGVECYEITSMSQPISVDLKYTIGFICSKMDKINDFNTKINQLFQSKQCYIAVNGHYMPMVLDTIGDDSRYSLDDRKFFNQTATVTVMGYIIPRDDIKIELKPKRVSAKIFPTCEPKTYVDMDFQDGSDTLFNLNIKYKDGAKTARFMVEDKMYITYGWKDNANKVKIFVNGEDYDTNSRILLNPEDYVSVSIIRPNKAIPSAVVFRGDIL